MLNREDARFWRRCPQCLSDDSSPTLSPLNVIRFAINAFGRVLQVLAILFWLLASIKEWPGGVDREDFRVPSPLVGVRRKCGTCGARFLGGSAPRSDPVCGQCGYNLTGNTSGVCPECGWRLPRIMQVLIHYEGLAQRRLSRPAVSNSAGKGSGRKVGNRGR